METKTNITIYINKTPYLIPIHSLAKWIKFYINEWYKIKFDNN